MSAASIDEVVTALNAACKGTGFGMKRLSFEDVQRGLNWDGSLSLVGRNIADVTIGEKSGVPLWTMRSDNWNEKLGRVDLNELALVVGNNVPGSTELTSKTAAEVLANIGEYGKYTGLEARSMAMPELDRKTPIRFQAVFLPVSSEDKATSQFLTQIYSYQSRQADPRNLLILGTAQGLSIQHDEPSAIRLPQHLVGADGKIHRYWLEGERAAEHKVGGAQIETTEEAAAAAARGKSTSRFIGTKAMGQRFNIQILLQVPVVQKPRQFGSDRSWGGGFGSDGGSLQLQSKSLSYGAALQDKSESFSYGAPQAKTKTLSYQSNAQVQSSDDFSFGSAPSASFGAAPPAAAALTTGGFGGSSWSFGGGGAYGTSSGGQGNFSTFGSTGFGAAPIDLFSLPAPPAGSVRIPQLQSARKPAAAVGTANAARVSRGSEYDSDWKGLTRKDLVREAVHATATVTMYYTMAGGTPSKLDAERAMADLENLYAQCDAKGNLADMMDIVAPAGAYFSPPVYAPATASSTFPVGGQQ